jgi:hypothetical protein
MPNGTTNLSCYVGIRSSHEEMRNLFCQFSENPATLFALFFPYFHGAPVLKLFNIFFQIPIEQIQKPLR